MIGALLYLRFASAWNWLKARARRLRQPKYLFGALVGCGYFYFFFFRHLGDGPVRATRRAVTEQALPGGAGAHLNLPLEWLPAMTAFGSLALLAFLTLMWVVPARRAALGFSEAEIAFLFPAPITRRALVHFRLISAQLRSLIGAGVMMLFSHRWTVMGGNAATHAIGWWFIFAALNLHFSGASFTLTRLADLGLRTWRRRVLAGAVVAAFAGVTLARLPAGDRLPALPAEIDFRPVTAWAIAVTETAPLSWLLWPIQRLIAPFLAVDGGRFLAALAPALGILVLHYLWVVRSAVAFEEASIEHAEKRGARLAAWRSGTPRHPGSVRRRPGPFRLADTGRPEFAFLWKNLLSTWQYFNVRVLLGSAAVIVGLAIAVNARPEAQGLLPGVGALALMFGAYVLVVGPQFARQDIRSDLANADILKTYPLPGWRIVLGELLAPVAILSGVLWLALLTGALAFAPTGAGAAWLSPAVRIALAVGVAGVTPLLVTLQLLVPNAAALVFPGWFQVSRTRGGGPEMIGQRMIFFFAQLLAMLLALLPAAALAAVLVFILQGWIGMVASLAVATLCVAAILLIEIGCGLRLLGRRFEALDIPAELRH
jgi:hypothetical protein